MSDDLFETAPPPPSGLPFWQANKHDGVLTLFEVSHVGKDFAFGEEKDHVFGTAYAITGPEAGKAFQLKTPNKKIVAQLKPMSGKRVAGRIAKSVPKGGGNAAWIIETELNDIDRKLVTDFLHNRPVTKDAEEVPF